MRVLVTGARSYYALPVIRVLGQAGHHVTAADWHRRSAGFYSRYTIDRLVYPKVATCPDSFARAVATYLHENPHDVVLPLYEEALPLSGHAEELPCDVLLPLAPYDRMLQMHDKRSLYWLAQELGVPIPRTSLTTDRRPSDSSFPVVIKVCQSSSARGVRLVHDDETFERACRELRQLHKLGQNIPLLVQEHIHGQQICTLSYAYRGRPKGTLVYKNVCEFPDRGGAGIVRESIRHRDIEEFTERLLRQTDWNGVIGFDFLVDESNGQPYLIDANPRFTPAVLLAQRCGLDLIGMATSRDEPAVAAMQPPGLRTRFDPLVALWMLRSLLPQRDWNRKLALTVRMLRPNARSRSDFFDPHDVRSLRALPAALFDLLQQLATGAGGALELIRDSQFCDYSRFGSPDARR